MGGRASSGADAQPASNAASSRGLMPRFRASTRPPVVSRCPLHPVRRSFAGASTRETHAPAIREVDCARAVVLHPNAWLQRARSSGDSVRETPSCSAPSPWFCVRPATKVGRRVGQGDPIVQRAHSLWFCARTSVSSA